MTTNPAYRPDPLLKLEVSPALKRKALRFFAAVMVLVVVQFAGVVALNVVVNPHAEFPTRVVRPIVQETVGEKVDLLAAFDPDPTVVVIGSSRSMAWPANVIANGTGFNFGISAATIKDLAILWEYVVQQRGAPDLLILNVDPFSLRPPESGYESQVLDSSAAQEVAGRAPSTGAYVERALQSYSWAYARDSLRALQFAYVTGSPVFHRAFEPDGVQHWPLEEAKMAQGAFDVEATVTEDAKARLPKIYATAAVYGHQLPVDDAQVDRLHTLFDRIVANGTRVWAVMGPIHPIGLDYIEDDPGFTQFQGAMTELLLSHCGPLFQAFDYTNITSYGGDPAGFFDSVHPTVENGARLLEAAAAGRGDICAQQETS